MTDPGGGGFASNIFDPGDTRPKYHCDPGGGGIGANQLQRDPGGGGHTCSCDPGGGPGC